VREGYLARTFRVGERGRRHRKRPSGPWRGSLLQFRPRASTPRILIAVAPAAKSWRTRHPILARCGVAVCRRAVFMVTEGQRPQRHGQFSTRRLPFRLAENLFADLYGPPIERLGLHVAREVIVRKRQVIQRLGSFCGIWAKCRCHQTQCRFIE